MVDDAADGECRESAAAERIELPGRDPATAVLRSNADDAANYGAIGAIIGHEISHSFDNTGADFDAQGKMENWWTPQDAAHFEAATQKLVKQYNQYEALPGLHVNGQQTLGRKHRRRFRPHRAYAAYHKSLGGKPAPVIDNLTGDQRFFLAFGQAWRYKIRDAALASAPRHSMCTPRPTSARKRCAISMAGMTRST
jgi:predicted metalloendopeptidase